MEKNGVVRLYVFSLHACFAAIWLLQCDASNARIGTHRLLDSSNIGPYISSPFSMAPYYDSLPGPTPIPPTNIPSPAQPVIGQPISEPGSRFLPPLVYPHPMVPPPPNQAISSTLWCVAKASVPEPIIEEAMNYACGSGADCDGIQPSGPCFQPDTLFAHASYAYNSYWQRVKVTGGACDFGGTAVLVNIDPSYDGCHFVYF